MQHIGARVAIVARLFGDILFTEADYSADGVIEILVGGFGATDYRVTVLWQNWD